MAYGAIMGQKEIPTGIIVLWSGSSLNIPVGWVLCNGQNNTPDLRDKFIIGAGNDYSPSDTGGQDSISISVNNLPAHTHNFDGSVSLNNIKINESGSHTHSYTSNLNSGDPVGGEGNGSVYGRLYGGRYSNPISILESGAHTHTISGSATASGTTGSTGSGQPISNLPPYYALCYIMKL